MLYKFKKIKRSDQNLKFSKNVIKFVIEKCNNNNKFLIIKIS